MSTSIDILPRLASYPRVEDVRSEFEARLNGAIAQHGATIQLKVVARRFASGRQWICKEDAIWDAEGGLWLIMLVDGVVVEAVDGCWFEDERDGPSTAAAVDEWSGALDEETCSAILRAGHVGYFERRAGAPALVNLGYGLAAGATALLTEGVVCSVDGAAPDGWFPMEAAAFLDRWAVGAGGHSPWASSWDEQLLTVRERDPHSDFRM